MFNCPLLVVSADSDMSRGSCDPQRLASQLNAYPRTKMLTLSLSIVHLRLPRVQDIGYLAQGLAMFPHVKVTVQSLKGASGMTWLFQRQTMKLMCEAIAAARSARSTTWDDEGDLETAYLFVDALPTGFKTAGKTAIAGLDGEEAWL